MARFRKNDFFKWAQKIKSVFCFIPHTHEGCDLDILTLFSGCPVSIHTPTKGVTSPPFRSEEVIFSFNPHTHEGCDLVLVSLFLAIAGFNPHTHEGCDRWKQL